MRQQYDTFIERHQPTDRNKPCCPSMAPALFARFLLRAAVPILIGVSIGMLSEWGERKAGIHNDERLLELSDFTGCAVTLIVAYTMNALLDCCWPSNPYQQTDFFQPAASGEYTDSVVLKNRPFHA